MAVLRIGVLGAARITPPALLRPATVVSDVEVVAVAARDRGRAEAFARRHGIGRVHGGYAELVGDPEVDAVYVPLPNGLHAEWTLRALANGKHVLCEKPMTSNADEARRVAEAARAAGLVVMEAFHYRYHPLMARALELVRELGALRSVETSMCIPLPVFKDIRYRLDLAGGAQMDTGCYAVHAMRTLAGATPEVTAARATERSPGVDRVMVAEYRFPDGATGRTAASLWSRRLLSIRARVVGEAGELRILNFAAPQFGNLLTLKTAGGTRRQRVGGEATYTCQLRAFAAAVLRGGPNLTPPEDAVTTMGLIDDTYRAAGLTPRG